MPTDEPFPFSIDCATSVTQRGKIEVYARQKKDMPPGWVVGSDGTTKTDSVAVLDELVKGTAALTPVGGIGEDGGGYKGYGWATVVEMLSAALQQGAFMKGLLGFDAAGKRQPYKLGHFFIAIDIEAFTDLASFKKTTGDICRALRASKKAPGESRIWTAGEKEWDAWLERKDKGVPFDAVEMKEFDGLKAELKLSQYPFPWEK
jgi:LDH2 family malate/lactate/ureidoglycolate dehydrogenase